MVPLDQPSNALALVKEFTLPKAQPDDEESEYESLTSELLDREMDNELRQAERAAEEGFMTEP